MQPAGAVQDLRVGDLVDLARLSSGLEYRDGMWFGRGLQPVSYPEHAHRECLAVEDGSFWFAHRNRCILEWVRRFPTGDFLLDIGAGNGFVSQALRNAGVSVCALEPGLDGCRAAVALGLPVVACASLETARFNPEVLPSAGLFDVLEHIEDDLGFLRAVAGLLRPEGRLYVSVPALPALWSAADEYSGHFRRYRRASLCQALVSSGFEVEWSSYLFAPLLAPVFLTRSLPSRYRACQVSRARRQRDHAAGAGPWGALLTRLLALEFKRIAAGRTLPFGTSCFAVARRSGSRGGLVAAAPISDAVEAAFRGAPPSRTSRW